jgi:hypothetical protein
MRLRTVIARLRPAAPEPDGDVAMLFITARAAGACYTITRLLEAGLEPRAIAYPRRFEATLGDSSKLFGQPLVSADVEGLEVIVR